MPAVKSSTSGSIAISSRRGRPSGAMATSSADAAREPRPRPTAPPSSRASRLSGQQLPRDPPPAGAERGVDRQLLLPAFRAHEEQIGDVRAGDEQNEADRAEQHPQHAADVADDVHRERPDVRCHLHVVEHLAREAGGSGNRSDTSGIMRATSAFACSMVTPGLSRATP